MYKWIDFELKKANDRVERSFSSHGDLPIIFHLHISSIKIIETIRHEHCTMLLRSVYKIILKKK
jgi:hypothetical protein